MMEGNFFKVPLGNHFGQLFFGLELGLHIIFCLESKSSAILKGGGGLPRMF